ncbi:MAG: ankyrin repeat domain-containing protein [Candidatus Rokubacteria bacterium]|nr:ankyrin repeat domain-containing protein [Candidatus Rokubacteria bacterium]
MAARGADPDGDDGWQRALHTAAIQGHADIVQRLIARGADVYAPRTDGATPLHTAAEGGKLDVVNRLLRAGADPARRDAQGRRPADLARANGHARVAERLA